MPGSEERGTIRANLPRSGPALLRRLRTSMGILALVAVAILLSACTFKGDTMTIDPGHSPENKEIWGLYSIVWWLALMIFILVEVALFYAIFRFRRRPGQFTGQRGFPVDAHPLAATADDWTDALELLLANAEQRQRLAEAGRKTIAQKYSLQLHAPMLEQVLRAAAA